MSYSCVVNVLPRTQQSVECDNRGHQGSVLRRPREGDIWGEGYALGCHVLQGQIDRDPGESRKHC